VAVSPHDELAVLGHRDFFRFFWVAINDHLNLLELRPHQRAVENDAP
jgi:hypothetical protein